jgi:hypothetical protein
MNSMKVVLKDANVDHCNIICYPDGQYSLTLDLAYFNDPKQPLDQPLPKNLHVIEVI